MKQRKQKRLTYVVNVKGFIEKSELHSREKLEAELKEVLAPYSGVEVSVGEMVVVPFSEGSEVNECRV